MVFLEKVVDFCVCDVYVLRIIVLILINFKEDWKLFDYYVLRNIDVVIYGFDLYFLLMF